MQFKSLQFLFPSFHLPLSENGSLLETVQLKVCSVHFHVNQSPYETKGFAAGFVLKQRHEVTWRWLVLCSVANNQFGNKNDHFK